MSDRGLDLRRTADGQIAELIELLSTRGQIVLGLPCPGRQKLGDGTVAACALHTADNYHRIAGFLQGQSDGRHHRIGRSLHGHGDHKHEGGYTAEDIDLPALLDRLSAGRAALRALADLTDAQLDTVPPASEMKFCDGQRTLEQVVTNLLNHQSHQLDALKSAIS
jgi:hypothetical protein